MQSKRQRSCPRMPPNRWKHRTKSGVMPLPHSPFKEFPELRKLAADLILKHRLPITASRTLFAGYGNGSPCRLCSQPITRTDIEYELTDDTFTRDGIRLHLWCHAAWQMELADIPNTVRLGDILEH